MIRVVTLLSLLFAFTGSTLFAQAGSGIGTPCFEIEINGQDGCVGIGCFGAGGGAGFGEPGWNQWIVWSYTGSGGSTLPPEMEVSPEDLEPNSLTNDPYVDAVHRAKWMPTAASLMPLFTWEGTPLVSDHFEHISTAPPSYQSQMAEFDQDSYELQGMTPPGEATLHDFYGVNLATGQVEVSLPTGIRLTGMNGDDLELKINIRSGIQRRGRLGQFASLNMSDRLVINKLIPLTESTPGVCNTVQSEMWQVRDLVNSTPTLTRLRGGNPEIWYNIGDPGDNVLADLKMGDSAFFAGYPDTKWAILHQNSNVCKFSHPDGTLGDPTEFLWKSGRAGMPPGPGAAKLFFGAADPYLTDLIENPPEVFHTFVASWGQSETLLWDCGHVVIMDADGNKTVYSPFFKQIDTRVCLSESDLPHGGQQGTLPGGIHTVNSQTQGMAQVQLVATCLYKETLDGLRTYYLYDTYGVHVGFRDPAGREIGFNAGRIGEIRDQFGRTCNLLYDDNGCLESIALPDVVSGSAGQPQLDSRVIEVKMTVVDQSPRPEAFGPRTPSGIRERKRLDRLQIATPLDVKEDPPGDYSFEAIFEEFGEQPYTGNRVTSVRCSSDRMPDWLPSGTTAGGTTTYQFPDLNQTTCGENYTVVETRPDTKVVTHTFDAIGNLISVTEPAKLELSGSEIPLTTTIESANGADELNLKTSMTYPDLTGEAWEYQFQTDGGLDTYFRYAVGADTHQQFFAKHNVLKETQKGIGGEDLVTQYVYGEYRRLRSKIAPMPYGTVSPGMEFEHEFDYDDDTYPGPIRHVVTQTRYPDFSSTQYGGDDFIQKFTYNDYGQLETQTVWNGGVAEVSKFTRHVINDPDGDGSEDWPIVGDPDGLPGYLKDETVDYTEDPGGLNLVTSHAYDRWGNEIQTTHPGGNMTYRRFNEMNQAYAIHEGTFTINSSSGEVELPAGDHDGYARAEHVFDEAGNVTEVWRYNDNPDTRSLGANSDAVTTKYEYDGLDRLVHVTQERANPIDLAVEQLHTYWVRDELGRITLETRPNNSATYVEYSPQGTVLEYREHFLASTDPVIEPADDPSRDRVMKLTYDENKRVKKGEDALGEFEELYYDNLGRLIGRRNPHGTLTRQTLNDLGLPTREEVLPAGTSITSTTAVPLKETTFVYDERYRVQTQDVSWFRTEGGGQIGDGKISTTMTYDAKDQVVKVTDDRGGVTGTIYDKAGRKRFLIHPQTAELPSPYRNADEWRYDENGNVVKMLLHEYGIPDGGSGPILNTYSVTYHYDDLNREFKVVRAVVDGEPADTERWYDSLGNVWKELNPGTDGSVGTRYKLDSLGQVVQIEDGFLSNFSGPAPDLFDPITGAADLVTLKKEYDLAGNIRLEYDDDDLQHPPTEYTYDLLGRRTGVKYGDGTYEIVEYRQDDLVQNLKAYTAQDTELFQLAYGYDDKRRTSETYSISYGPFTGLLSKQFVYDDLDRPTTATAISQDPHTVDRRIVTTTEREYDSLDRILSDTQALTADDAGTGGGFYVGEMFSAEVTSEYDALGNIEVTSSTGGLTGNAFQLTRTFDFLNRLRTVSDTTTGAQQFARYDWRGARGRIETIHHDVSQTRTLVTNYDARGRAKTRRTVKNSDDSLLAGRTYKFAPNSVRRYEAKLETANPVDDHVFTHDALARLITFEQGECDETTGSISGNPTSVERMGYDGAGSLRAHTLPGTTTAITNDTDDTNAYATGFDGALTTRDERGNMSEIKTLNFVYDVFGHLVGTVWPYQVNTRIFEVRDAFDRRVYREKGPVEKAAFVHEGIRVLQEVLLDLDTFAHSVKREYVHGAGLDELVGQRIDGDACAMHVDSLGTPHAATTTGGVLAETYDTDPFGNVVTTDKDGGGEIGNLIGLAGMWYDEVTNMYFVRARHYSPFLRRFTSRDPLGVWGDAVNRGNAYAYVWNSPTANIDPTGLGNESTVTMIYQTASPQRLRNLNQANEAYAAAATTAVKAAPSAIKRYVQGAITQTPADAQNFSNPNASTDSRIMSGMNLIFAGLTAGGSNLVKGPVKSLANKVDDLAGSLWNAIKNFVTKSGDNVLGVGSETAVKSVDSIPATIYRSGTPGNANHVKLRQGEEAISFRESLSNALPDPGKPPEPVLKPGQNYIEVDTGKLPKGSVAVDGGVDGNPVGHVSVSATPEKIVEATVGGGKFPKKPKSEK